MSNGFASFEEFYPYYLHQHQNPACRRLHFVGTGLLFLILFAAFATHRWTILWLLPIVGYGFAWIGHIAFEHNRPATFRHPWYSLAGDFRMFFEILIRRIPL